jgi:AmmeMemoRadiSam system protein A
MSLLGRSEKKILLEEARRALLQAVEGRDLAEDFPGSEVLQRPGGAFVTLRHRGRLRGCIGQFASQDPLIEVVRYCAKAAALEDPRFEPVRAEGLAELELEISVLSAAQEILIEEIEIGRHGLIVARGWQRGVLLPQVAAEFHWTAERFVEETCAKAGLERGAWRDPATQVYAFTAEVFRESEFAAEPEVLRNPPYSTSR